ncbi:oxidative stress defense protein [Shimwellia blattae]|uniref:Periplasmic immunogenic protein n=1 Tax=Shimwellia blattae (strain ATCC 29907 / DSM 4481 / JCM 1650 / NBRC 105725 / CDC 9005-74) TaxID=630626 RepID=I2B5C5_SHIBC|nr:oxidative stress defense protein [Shimwellia blattae]AFJ45729.1 periplasmic immunogenic protein [Shimwellia blattae DSM 4481 = NBRC 105725]GAB82177.1 hypothetical protein YggE [Shimwellia blattae DSM 4481 = NBRC 105725]VDY63212.1 26 kDa periplasmic immunogenic protein precursor [Shimwellia blattae]VEC20889.1 26 kDa periplasmic immunogenic protein precursor [Shimwellia blattae]
MKFKILVLAAMMGLGGSATAMAADLPDSPHIVTTGTATVDAVPDIARLNIEVNVSAKDAGSAKKQADQKVAQYMTFLQNNGVEKKDINAANLRTQPVYEYSKEGKAILKGYQAIRNVTVTVRNLNKLNDLLDGALKAGLNEIRSVSFEVDQPQAYQDKARQAAIENAIHQASKLAEGFHTKLGPVWSIRYQVSDARPMPVMRMMKASAAPEASVSDTYEQQKIQFDDRVEVVFGLDNGRAPAPAAH